METPFFGPMEGIGGIATRESQTGEAWEGMTGGRGVVVIGKEGVLSLSACVWCLPYMVHSMKHE